MPTPVLMPQLSPTMTEGRLAKWVKKEGDAIRAGDVIAEVETDKATMEVEASEDGILHAILGKPEEDYPVGACIAVLRKKDEKVPADYKPEGKAAAPAATGTPTPSASGEMVVEKPASTQQHEVVAAVPLMSTGVLPKINLGTSPASAAAAQTGAHVKASPLARRLAGTQGVDLSTVVGTGPHGRVTAADVTSGARTGGSRTITRKPDALQKLTPMRKTIASRLLASKQTVPHFYLSRDVTMDATLALRSQLNNHLEPQKTKLTVNDFILKASALALADFPAANAAWNADSVVQFGNVDISVAVAIDGGLITPIVLNANQKTLPQISAEVKQLVADAKAGKLKPEQYEGGSFSLSNLGMYGVDTFSAIINPPQAAILACGTTRDVVILSNGTPTLSKKMTITLSVDHRVIDGALGAELLGRITHYLETPALMLL